MHIKVCNFYNVWKILIYIYFDIKDLIGLINLRYVSNIAEKKDTRLETYFDI